MQNRPAPGLKPFEGGLFDNGFGELAQCPTSWLISTVNDNSYMGLNGKTPYNQSLIRMPRAILALGLNEAEDCRLLLPLGTAY
jgi:hypothetical protein